MVSSLVNFPDVPEFKKGLRRLGWSQAAFARSLGLVPSAVTEAMRRGRLPRPYLVHLGLLLELKAVRDRLDEILTPPRRLR